MDEISVNHYKTLYHGTSIESGFSILNEGIRIPNFSRWSLAGQLVPLEHGFRFYTCPAVKAAVDFAQDGMILKFKSPLPKGIVEFINPGPGGGHIQVSFGHQSLQSLMLRLTQFSLDGGRTWKLKPARLGRGGMPLI